MIPEKALKILTLALDGAAHDGEWKTAAVMFVSMLRKANYSADLFDKPPPRTHYRKPEPPPRRTIAKMPFGMHKGKSLSDVPTDYLEWILDLKNLKSALRRQITDEMRTRAD